MTHVKFNNRMFERSLNNMANEFFNGFPVLFSEGYNSLTKHGYVPVNIRETDSAYQVEVVAPGMEKKDFKVTLEDNVLTIVAEKKTEEKKESSRQIRREYSYRGFKRSFTIDEKVDATNIEASYVNGVLTLNLPKKTDVKEASKEITVN